MSDADFTSAVERLDFRVSRPQWLDHRPWHAEPRRCDFVGRCCGCGTRCYEFADGCNDPRGPLGDHAASCVYPDDSDYPESFQTIVACFMCMNDELRYRSVMNVAEHVWRHEAKKITDAMIKEALAQ